MFQSNLKQQTNRRKTNEHIQNIIGEARSSYAFSINGYLHSRRAQSNSPQYFGGDKFVGTVKTKD